MTQLFLDFHILVGYLEKHLRLDLNKQMNNLYDLYILQCNTPYEENKD